MNNSHHNFPEESFVPQRKPVTIQTGELVSFNNEIYRITEVLDFASVIAVAVETGRSAPLRIKDLQPLNEAIDVISTSKDDLADIADEDWKIAQTRFAAIAPLAGKGSIGRAEIELRAKEVGVDPSTLYRWLKRYNAYGHVMALIPQKRGWATGKSRISSQIESVVEQTIRDYYLTPQRPTVKKTITEVFRRCQERGIVPPSHVTIRNRISKISEKEQLRGRGYKEKAKNKFIPTPGRFPNAQYPLAVVQMDHTPADIILVDDVHRKPIGRPWITLAMDIYSRIVTGYYLSFDPPSETSVAMCTTHSILPKEEWMLLHSVDADWPVWGTPRTIHVDNAAEFRSNNFQKSCLLYGINLEFRPVRQPRYVTEPQKTGPPEKLV